MLDEARALVLGANPIAYGVFTGSAERGVYELILKYKALAQAMTGDVQACSDTCKEAIRSIKAQRYLVNSPECQSAFLDWRADFYRFGVAAARKLGNWDQMLYLATHGTSVFQSDTLDHPMESRLILHDGLDGLEIAELRLQADLVVLSACSSGQRAVKERGLQELPGDDVFGLQSTLFTAGARSVLGALWPLKDEQAFHLVRRFHTHFAAGNPAGKSLQLAVNGYPDQNPRREIFYWAGFFLSTLGNEAEISG